MQEKVYCDFLFENFVIFTLNKAGFRRKKIGTVRSDGATSPDYFPGATSTNIFDVAVDVVDVSFF